MKKSKLLIALLALVLFIPSMVNALSVERVFTTLTDYLTPVEREELNYTETSEQVTIYLFRGEGCSHCKEFLDYLSTTLVKTHGAKFKLRAYEVWYNQANKELMNKAAQLFDEKPDGVPYIVIGNKSWMGFTDIYKAEIEKAIDEEYDKKDRFDILDEIKNQEKKEKEEKEKEKKKEDNYKKIDNCAREREKSEDAVAAVVLILILVSVGSGFLILLLVIFLICVAVSNSKKKKEIARLNVQMANLQNEVVELNKNKEKKNEKK